MNHRLQRLSLEHKLPLAVSGLLVLVIGGFCWAAYREVGHAAVVSATDGLERTSRQLADLFAAAARQRRSETRALASHPSLRAFLRHPAPGSRAAATEVLDSLRRSSALVASVELWTPAGERLIAVGEAGDPASAPAPPPLAAPDSAHIGPVYLMGETPLYAVAAAVPSAGRPAGVEGYLVQRRRVAAGAQAVQQFAALIGPDAGLLLGNQAGDLWTDFIRPVAAPPPDAWGGGPLGYERPGLGPVLARVLPVAGTPWAIGVELPRDRVLARARGTLGRLVLIALGIVGLGAAGAWAASRRMTRPLASVTRAAEAIAAGRPVPPLAIERGDEIGRLGEAFRHMAARVEQARRDLEDRVAERTRELEDARRRLEQASEERYRALFHENPLPMWVYDQHTLAFLDVNEAAVRHYGYSRDEFLAMTLKDIRPPDEVPRFLASLPGSPAGLYEAGVWRHRKKDGSEIEVEITRRRVDVGGRTVGLVLAHDITSRLAAERSLRASEEALRRLNAELERRVADRTATLQASEARFRALAETANDAIISADAEGRITYFNPAAERIFGYSASEAVGEPLTLLMPERFRAAHQAGLARYRAGGEARVVGRTVELAGRRKDGAEFPIELSLAAWSGGEGPSFTAILRDISDRKQAQAAIEEHARQLDRANAELQAVNRELEAFSYSVSHDLRAPLRAMDGFSRIVLEEHAGGLDPEGRRLLDVVRENARRMGQLIDDLLAFSRLGRQPLRARSVDLVELAREVAAELRAAEPERAIEITVAPLPPARGDRALLRQVLVNLLQNAVKFTRGRAPARIEVGARDGGNGVVYYVADNGVGFDPRYADKLFGVFQRLHRAEEFEGTGVGLATVQRIVHRHGGRVWAEGAPDHGATFYFTLAAEEAAQ